MRFNLFLIIFVNTLVFCVDSKASSDFCSIQPEEVLAELKVIHSGIDEKMRAFSELPVSRQAEESQYFSILSYELAESVRKSAINALNDDFSIQSDWMVDRIRTCTFITPQQMDQYGDEVNVKWRRDLKYHAFYGEDANVAVISPFVLKTITERAKTNSLLPIGILTAHEFFHSIEHNSEWPQKDLQSDFFRIQKILFGHPLFLDSTTETWKEDKSDFAAMRFAADWLSQQPAATIHAVRSRPTDTIFSFMYWINSAEHGRHSSDSARIQRFLRFEDIRKTLGCR